LKKNRTYLDYVQDILDSIRDIESFVIRILGIRMK